MMIETEARECAVRCVSPVRSGRGRCSRALEASPPVAEEQEPGGATAARGTQGTPVARARPRRAEPEHDGDTWREEAPQTAAYEGLLSGHATPTAAAELPPQDDGHDDDCTDRQLASPSRIPSLCTHFKRAGIEWRRCHHAVCMTRPCKEPHHSGQAQV